MTMSVSRLSFFGSVKNCACSAGGQCLKKLGQTCNSGGDCASGACTGPGGNKTCTP